MAETNLKAELLRLDGYLAQASVSQFWKPGLTLDEIKDIINGVFDVPIPSEAVEWYGWHGGLNWQTIDAERESTSNYVYTEFTADGLVHPGLDRIIDTVSQYIRDLDMSLSEFWPGRKVFPIAIDYDAGIHWLHRKTDSEPWRLWQTGEEFDLQPHWNSHEIEPKDGPTLLEWVTAKNNAFERGDLIVTDEGAVMHRKGDESEQYTHYPWPSAL